MISTWCGVRLLTLSRPSMRTHRIMGDWCSCDWRGYLYRFEIFRILHSIRTRWFHAVGSFSWISQNWGNGQNKVMEWCSVFVGYGENDLMCWCHEGNFRFEKKPPIRRIVCHNFPVRQNCLCGIVLLETWPPLSAWPLPCVSEMRGIVSGRWVWINGI